MAGLTVTKAPGFCIDADGGWNRVYTKEVRGGGLKKRTQFSTPALQPAIQAGFVCIDAVSTARPSDILNE